MFKHQLFNSALFVTVATMSAPAIHANQTPPPPTPPVARPAPQGAPAEQTAGHPKSSDATKDGKFLKKAYDDGQAEIALAVLADSKSQNADVKAFASKIKSDHEQANRELAKLAASKNVTLPQSTETPQKRTATETEVRDTMKRLQSLNGAEFDRAYADAMVTDHQTAVAEFKKGSKSADPDVRAFADKTLPVLKEHLQRAEELQKKTGT
jgi:putative membrane protein